MYASAEAPAAELRGVTFEATDRSEVLRASRLPAFLVPVLIFPPMFYALFGLMLGGRNPIAALGAVPFCALGCALAFAAGPNSAPMIANLIYLPLSLASGLWIPIEFMPSFIQRVAPLMPPYHGARPAVIAIGGEGESATLHSWALALFAALFLAAAVCAYRRDDGRTWG